MGEDTTKRHEEEDRTLPVGTVRRSTGLARKAYLVVLAGWEIGREVELRGGEYTFGRSLKASVWINLPSVSREHAKIACTGEDGNDCYVVSDLKSSNGTTVNGVPVTSQRLHNGDKVGMGDVLFKFVLADEADERFYRDVHRLIHFDQLTGLLKMDAFRRQVELEMQRPDSVFTLAMTDLDGLKKVNDTHGHLAGRMVVREMGVLIRRGLRRQDFAALYGGDETAMLYAGCTADHAKELAENLRAAFESHLFEHKERPFRITISQGLAEWPRDGKTIEEIIAAADGALYAAKAAGRNCVRIAGAASPA